MMNDTVARIVEIMFQDVEMNEETSAIRDEVMNNCQERYIDMVNSGMSEDDAIAAVIESLKGMEEVLAPYKKAQQAFAGGDEQDSEQHVTFAASLVHAVDVELISENVTIEASDDDDYHVTWVTNENTMLKVELRDGVIRVERMPNDAVKMKAKGQGAVYNKEGMADFVRTEKGKIEINLDSIDGMFKSIGDTIKNAFTNLRINVDFGDGAVTIQVPENAMSHVKVATTSGDVDVQDVALTDLHIRTISGDIDVDLDEDQHLEQAELRTTSGDIKIRAFTDRMIMSSTSGDVDIEGSADDLSVNTISGDIDLRAEVENIGFKAISGDVSMTFDSIVIREVRGSTISGDIDIDLPEGIGTLAIHTQTRSGDVTTRCHTDGVGPTVGGSVTSMSGDITIR